MVGQSNDIRQIARARYDSANYGPAIALYKNVLQQNPDDAEARSLRGDALRRIGRLAKAERELDRAIATAPSANALAFRAALRSEQGALTGAAADLATALQFGPANINLRISRARLLFRSGELAQAHKKASKAALLCPSAADAWCLLGEVQTCRGQYRQAQDQLRTAHQLRPHDPQIAAALASASIASYAETRLSSVLESADATLRLSEQNAPDNIYAALAQAQLAHAMAQPERQLALAQAILGREPTYVAALEEKAFAWVATAQNLALASAFVGNALAHHPGRASLWAVNATLLAAQGNARAALLSARQAVARNADSAPMQTLLSRYAHQTGDLTGAKFYLESAFDAKPDSLAAHLERSDQNIQDGDFARALHSAMHACSVAPQNPVSLSRIAQALSALEMHKDVVQLCDKFAATHCGHGSDQAGFMLFLRAKAKHALGLHQDALNDLRMIPAGHRLQHTLDELTERVEATRLAAVRGVRLNATLSDLRAIVAGGDAAGAVLTADEMLRHTPADINVLALKARALLSLGALSIAKTCLDRAKEVEARTRQNPDPVLLHIEAELNRQNGTWWRCIVQKCQEMFYVGLGTSAGARLLTVFV